MEEEDIDKEHYNQLFELYKESGAQFDKQILYIASGALGLTMTFISDVVSLACAQHKFLLSVLWSLLTLIILISLLSHYLSLKAMNHRMQNLYKKKDKNSKILNTWVEGLNIAMLVGLPIGIALIILFISLNI